MVEKNRESISGNVKEMEECCNNNLKYLINLHRNELTHTLYFNIWCTRNRGDAFNGDRLGWG